MEEDVKLGIESLAYDVLKDLKTERSRACESPDANECKKALIGYKPGDSGLKCGKSCELCSKLVWAVERAHLTSEATGLEWSEILSTWESHRDYWYMNYYQDCNQPDITDDKFNVYVFDTVSDFREAVGSEGFICPSCGKVSKSPYECKACDWKSYGFLRPLFKGAHVFIKEAMCSEEIFMPVAFTKADGQRDDSKVVA